MKPNKIGQIVKFHTPFPDENPNQLYVVLEIIDDVESPRSLIKALNTDFVFNPIYSALLNELEIVKVKTNDLLGYNVQIQKENFSRAIGNVIKVRDNKILLELCKKDKCIETNVFLTIEDINGIEHIGTLYVN